MKWSDRWWYYVGLGVLMIPLSFYEHSRLGELESATGPESIRVTQLEHAVYSVLGKMGVLIVYLLLSLVVIAFGVHQFLKGRKET